MANDAFLSSATALHHSRLGDRGVTRVVDLERVTRLQSLPKLDHKPTVKTVLSRAPSKTSYR